jgi:O-antigen ligase
MPVLLRDESISRWGNESVSTTSCSRAPGRAATRRTDLPVIAQEETELVQTTTRPGPLAGADAVTWLSFYVFLLMLIPSPLTVGTLGSAGAPATIFAAVLFCWYLVTWLSPSRAPSRAHHPIRIAAVFFGCGIIASYVSVNRHALATLQQDAVDVGLIMLAGWLGVVLLTSDAVVSIDRLRTLLRRMVTFATVMGTIGIAQFFTGFNVANYVIIPGLQQQVPYSALLSRGDLRRPSSTALDPIEFAAVLVVTLPIAVHRARFAPPGRRLRRWLQVVIIAAAVPLTLSRTAFTALAAVALVLLPTWSRKERWIAVVAGGAGLVAAYAAVPSLLGTLSSLFINAGSDTSTLSRTGAFTLGGPFIAHNPWLGIGFNAFFPQTTFFTDDQYLNSLISTGLIGLVTLVALFVTGWVTVRSARRRLVDPQDRDLAQTIAAAVAACAVSFVSLDVFSFEMISGVTFLMLGCAGALWRLSREQRPLAQTE